MIRYRIVDVGLDARLREVRTQLRRDVARDDVEVGDIFRAAQRRSADAWIMNAVRVTAGDVAPAPVPFLEVRQLDPQDRRLQLVEAGIAAAALGGTVFYSQPY